jgi:hypothetical protein
MQNLLKDIFEKAKEEGVEIHVIHMGEEPKGEAKPKDELAEAKKEAEHIAELNKILYEAHICAGFTGEEALALTVATITCK